MIGPNLSEWAINRRSLVVYFMIVALIAGAIAFLKLGRNEDPAFTFRTMIVSAVWPGATMEETLQQVTERLERTLQETPNLDNLRSYTVPGQTTIFADLKGSTPPAVVATPPPIIASPASIRPGELSPDQLRAPCHSSEFQPVVVR